MSEEGISRDLTLFEQKQLRRVWHKEEWYYSITDVIGVLTDSINPNTYWRVLKSRLATEGFEETLSQI
jgi:DNA-damage-inducible protein D